MSDRTSAIAPLAALAGAVGICCALPVLLSLGVMGAVAGASLQSWTLAGLGLGLLALAWTRRARRRGHAARSRPDRPADEQPEPDNTTYDTRSEDHR